MRNKQFFSDAKKAQKSSDTFRLSSWMVSNISAFLRECPDDATTAEAHAWWENKAHQTLDVQLAQDVSLVLASGAAMMTISKSRANVKPFMSLTSGLVGIQL